MRRLFLALGAIVAAMAALVALPSASADHWSAPFWWAHTPGVEFDIMVNDMTTSYRDENTRAMALWSQSEALNMVPWDSVYAGTVVQVSEGDWGPSGWVGQTNISGNTSSGVYNAKVFYNNYYLQGRLNYPAHHEYTTCHELGHTLALGHRDVIFSNVNVGSCMDYTNDVDGGGVYGPSNLSPDAHDYEVLADIYDGTLPTTTTRPPVTTTTAAPTTTTLPDETTTTTLPDTTPTTVAPSGKCRTTSPNSRHCRFADGSWTIRHRTPAPRSVPARG
jgi:hypothetical protein